MYPLRFHLVPTPQNMLQASLYGRRPITGTRTYVCSQGWKHRLVIVYRYYIPCFSVIDYGRCFAFNFFYRLLPFRCYLLTCYRFLEPLNFTFVLVEFA